MKESIKKILGKRIRLVTQITIAICCIGAVAFFMPRNNVFTYTYSEEAPWNYGQIIAPFNFPIYKSNAQLAVERDSIAAHFEPYFAKDSAIVVNSLRKMKNRFYKSPVEGVPYESFIKYYNSLIRLYNQGIISGNDEARLAESLAERVNLVSSPRHA